MTKHCFQEYMSSSIQSSPACIQALCDLYQSCVITHCDMVSPDCVAVRNDERSLKEWIVRIPSLLNINLRQSISWQVKSFGRSAIAQA